MKKDIKGFTLTEVLVSVVIAGILVFAISSVFLRYRRLEKRFTIKENILTEIENIYALYTGSPDSFLGDLEEYLGFEESYKIYYKNDFQTATEEASKNYIQIEYSSIVKSGYTLYKLEVIPYYNDEVMVFTVNHPYIREIVVGDAYEE